MTKAVQVLFVTWDGPRSTYLQGLFLPIFVALRSRGFEFHVLQFTWADAEERAKLAKACRASGVTYRSATIWRRPVAPGSLATALWGRTHVRREINKVGIDLLMPRSTLPAVAAISAAGRGATRIPVLFDADGLPHDERVEFDRWSPTGLAYRLLRDFEAWCVRRADAVTVRTLSAAQILTHRVGAGIRDGHFHVIRNARDSRLFQPLSNGERALRRAEIDMEPEQPLLVYTASSLQGKYRGDTTLRFFRRVLDHRPDARLLILLPRLDEAHAMLAQHPDVIPACILRSAAPEDVAGWVGAADLGLALIHATYSTQAVAPIKLGEYLLCGVPVLASSGVGDTDAVVDKGVGCCLADLNEESLAEAAAWFVNVVLNDREGFQTRCRASGLEHFSMDSAVQGYEDALRAALSAQSGA